MTTPFACTTWYTMREHERCQKGSLDMTKPLANAQPVAMTMVEQYVELIKGAYDKWGRRIEGSPTWEDVDGLMCAILSAINPEDGHNDD